MKTFYYRYLSGHAIAQGAACSFAIDSRVVANCRSARGMSSQSYFRQVEVGGSNPLTPTAQINELGGHRAAFFVLYGKRTATLSGIRRTNLHASIEAPSHLNP